ncbi:hypothetical protein DFH09DRAFT_1131640 [Mycena vulgaris]|nr:hypothetical protein DFH09DRAFT_1131640 [Mycena vulgaris]
MVAFLPVELVREIVAYILVPPPSPVPEPGSNSKPKWSLIGNFSVACKTFRALALEAWFRVLFMRSPVDLSFLQNNLQEIRSSWTREIHCVANYHWQLDKQTQSDIAWDLAGFRQLKIIRLDCPSIIVIERSGEHHQRFPFLNIPASVMELDLRDLSWPSPFVFQAITATFPELKILRLSQRRVWCGLCHTCSSVRFVEPVPPKLVYKEGLGLPMHYALALAPLRHLHTVNIAMPYTNGTNIHLNPKNPAEDLWSGECDGCVGIMYADADFRERWIARKRGILLPDPGGKASDRLYTKPPALETVEWAFCSSEVDDDNDDDDDEETEVEAEAEAEDLDG